MMRYLAFMLAAFFVVTSCTTQHDHEGHADHGHTLYYTCSMDPQVVETKPGKCPICHMELTPIRLDQMLVNGLKLSDEQVMLGNIQTQKVRYGSVQNQVTATGVLKEDQNHSQFVNARVEGRIDKLNIKTNGTAVQKGQVLYHIYSEMLAATQSEFIQNWKQLTLKPNDPLLSSIHQTITNKLTLWGLTNSQIEQLKRLDSPRIPYPIVSQVSGVVKSVRISEGGTVMEGDPIFELTEYSSLWVEAEFYPNETNAMKEGSEVDVYVQGSKDETIAGTILQVLPQVVSSSTVHLVRISISTKDPNVRPGMQAHVAWHEKGGNSLVIPTQALLREANGHTVWTKNKEGVYEPKKVKLGQVRGGRAEVLHGLNDQEEIVISGAYLLQSEYVFKKGHAL